MGICSSKLTKKEIVKIDDDPPKIGKYRYPITVSMYFDGAKIKKEAIYGGSDYVDSWLWAQYKKFYDLPDDLLCKHRDFDWTPAKPLHNNLETRFYRTTSTFINKNNVSRTVYCVVGKWYRNGFPSRLDVLHNHMIFKKEEAELLKREWEQKDNFYDLIFVVSVYVY